MPAGRLYGVASPASKTSSMETETAWGVSDGYLQERYPINNQARPVRPAARQRAATSGRTIDASRTRRISLLWSVRLGQLG